MVGLTNWVTYAAFLIGVIIGLEFGLRWGHARLMRRLVEHVNRTKGHK
jgi:ABC-type nitrate/sulfonate/bicarbonate transport system permease component